MNFALYKASLKAHSKGLSLYLSSIIIYMIGLFLVFPSVSKSSGISDLMKSLPPGLMKSLGIEGNMANLNDYLNINFFNSLFLYILMAYCIMTTIKLVTRPLDRTSLVYYLSSPVSKSKVLFTQFMVFFQGLLLISLVTVLSGILGAKLLLGKHTFDVKVFSLINLNIFFIFLLIGAICFFFATVANTESLAMSVSAGVVIGDYAIDITKKLSTELDWLRYVDIFELYQPEKITKGTFPLFSTSLLLLIVSGILCLVSIWIFKNKDLNL